jgi:hypothetical protein
MRSAMNSRRAKKNKTLPGPHHYGSCCIIPIRSHRFALILATLTVVLLFVPLSSHEDLFPDGIHPNVEGAGMIAREVRRALIGT